MEQRPTYGAGFALDITLCFTLSLAHMFRLVKNPPSAYIGNTPVRLTEYSDSLESNIETPLSALQGVAINQYPAMLQCTVLLDGPTALPELEWCYLYRERPGNGIHLTFQFGSQEGIWKDNIAIGAAYRELCGLPDFERYDDAFAIDKDETTIYFVRLLEESSSSDLGDSITEAMNEIRGVVDAINNRLFGFLWKKDYESDEVLFTKEVVIPLLRKMGFQGVRYNHGVSEYGRDVIFSELDRFSNIRHCAAQVKAGNINASNGTLLNQLLVQIDDAFAMPVRGPGRNKNFYISEVFIVCSGKISDGAVERLNKKLDPRLWGSVHFLDLDDVVHLSQAYLRRQ